MATIVGELIQLPIGILGQRLDKLEVLHGSKFRNKVITAMFCCLHGVHWWSIVSGWKATVIYTYS